MKKHPLENFLTEQRVAKTKKVLNSRTRLITALFEPLHHPHNISAVIRSAEAFGIQDLHFVGSRDSLTKGITMGADKWIDLYFHTTTSSAVSSLKDQGYSLVAMHSPNSLNETTRENIPLYEIDFSKKIAFCFGSEKRGLSLELIKAVDFLSHIPMFGFVESLNISVTAAISFYHGSVISRAKQNDLALSDLEREAIYNKWLSRDVRNGEKILENLLNLSS